MQHIEQSAFRKGEYTALAGTAETLTRYRIIRTDGAWLAIPKRNSGASCVTCRTLREMDDVFVGLSK